jgi:hypothetical protein
VSSFRALALATAVLFTSAAAALGQPETVQSLLKAGYTVVGVIPSTAGAGVFLVKGDQLVACFVVETPQSAEVTTRYCKPVH